MICLGVGVLFSVGAYSPCILLLDAVDFVGKDRDGREG